MNNSKKRMTEQTKTKRYPKIRIKERKNQKKKFSKFETEQNTLKEKAITRK